MVTTKLQEALYNLLNDYAHASNKKKNVILRIQFFSFPYFLKQYNIPYNYGAKYLKLAVAVVIQNFQEGHASSVSTMQITGSLSDCLGPSRTGQKSC